MQVITINEEIFDRFPMLESDRLRYRTYEEKDAASLFSMRSDPKVMKYMDTTWMQSIDDAKKMIFQNHQSFVDKEGFKWVIAEKDSDKMIGDFGFWRIDKAHCRGEIGYALLSQYWGKGFMREAMNTLLKFGFEKINLHSVEANVNPNNKASINILKRFGFQQEAYFRENYLFNGEFLDSAIFSLLKKDFRQKKTKR